MGAWQNKYQCYNNVLGPLKFELGFITSLKTKILKSDIFDLLIPECAWNQFSKEDQQS